MAISIKKKKVMKGIQNDAKLLAGMVLTPLYKNPQMIQKLVGVMKGAKDQPDALAHSLFALMSAARNATIKNGIPVNSKAWLANGGAVDKVIIDVGGLLASQLGNQFLDKKFAQKTKTDLITIMHKEEVAAGGHGDPNRAPPPPAVAGAAALNAMGPSSPPNAPQAPSEQPGGLAAPVGRMPIGRLH